MKHNWEYKPLGEICQIGSARRVHQSDWKDVGVPFYRAREIIKLAENGYVDNDLFISNELFEEFSKSGLPNAGDIMLTAVGTLGVPYIVRSTDKFYYKDASVICLSSIKSITPEFLCYLFKSDILKKQISRQAKGATVGTITISNASKYIVPVPGMEEQERIVAELDAINELIEKNREVLRNLDALAQSLFYDTFGDPITNPKGWEIKKLYNECEDIVDGDHSAPPKSDTGIPFITISNIDKERNTIDFTNSFFVPQDYYDNLKPNRKAKKGDVLYTVTGSYGITVLIDDQPKFCFQRHIGLIRPKLSLNSIFLAYWGRSSSIKQYADNVATGIAQKTVSLTSLRNFPIILPPIALQEDFAKKIEAVEEQRAKVEATIAQLQTLLDSRMDYWFN